MPETNNGESVSIDDVDEVTESVTTEAPAKASKAQPAAKAAATAAKDDAKKHADAQKEGDKVIKAAELAQRKADKATEAAEKAQATAEAATAALATDATDQAKVKAVLADEAASAALVQAADAQREAKTALKAANKVRNSRRLTGQQKVAAPNGGQWVAPTFITVGLLGVLWLVVYYLTASVGIQLPLITDLAGWNVLIGMGLMAVSFGLATLWK